MVLFVASFHEACRPGGQMDTVLAHLANKYQAKPVSFYRIDAEEHADRAEELDVEVVPTVLFMEDNRVLDKVEGAVPAKVSEKLDQFMTKLQDVNSSLSVNSRIEDLLGSSYVFLFMKGTPQEPECKFSRKVLEILTSAGVENLNTFNVLEDDSIRQGLKDYSNWPTFPQLYAGGKLIGGVDIIEELSNEGKLVDTLTPLVEAVPPPSLSVAPTQPKRGALEEKLKALINQAPVMLFMKGDPQEPQCGFSAQIVKLLSEQKVQFGHFDILSDDAVRQGLKKFSDWPTYPQLYSKGKLVGGLDIVKELAEDDSLLDALEM